MNSKCPICNASISDNESQYCSECFWELVVIPANSSNDFKSYFQEKEKMYRKLYITFKENEKKIPEMNKILDECREEHDALQIEKNKLQLKKKELNKKLDTINTMTPISKKEKMRLENLKEECIQKEIDISELREKIKKDGVEYYHIYSYILGIFQGYIINRNKK